MLGVVLLALALEASQAPDRPDPAAPNDPPPCAAVRIDRPPADLTSDVQWITNLPVALSTPVDELRGRRIALRDVRVAQVDSKGFWIGIGSGEGCLYVRPAEGRLIQVRSGERVDLQGEFRHGAEQHSDSVADRTPFVYAYIVRKQPDDSGGSR